MAGQTGRTSPFFQFWANLAAPTPRAPAPQPQPTVPTQRPLFRPFAPLQQMPRPQTPPPAAYPVRPVASTFFTPRPASPVVSQPQEGTPEKISPTTSQPPVLAQTMPPVSQTLPKDPLQTEETRGLQKPEETREDQPKVASDFFQDIPIMRLKSEIGAETTEVEKPKTDDSEIKTEAAEDKKPETETRAEAAEDEKLESKAETTPEPFKGEKPKSEEAETKSEAAKDEKPKETKPEATADEKLETKRETIEDESKIKSETELEAAEKEIPATKPTASPKAQPTTEMATMGTDQTAIDQKDVTSSTSDGKPTETPISPDPNEGIAFSETGAGDSTSQATSNVSAQEDVSATADEQGAGDVKQSRDEHPSSDVILDAAGGSMTAGQDGVNLGAELVLKGKNLNKDEVILIKNDGDWGQERRVHQSRNGFKRFPVLINSNLQAINNSIVFKGSYREKDPGVNLLIYGHPADPDDPKKNGKTLEAHKAEMETTSAQNLVYEPNVMIDSKGIVIEI